jgi:hypothetical protein
MCSDTHPDATTQEHEFVLAALTRLHTLVIELRRDVAALSAECSTCSASSGHSQAEALRLPYLQ